MQGLRMADDAARQVRQKAERLWDERWTFTADMNGDGLVDLSDVGLWAKWVFFAPGDLLLLVCMKHFPGLALLLGLDAASLSGPLSGTLFFCVSLVVIALVTLAFVFLEEQLSRGRAYLLSLVVWLGLSGYAVYYMSDTHVIIEKYLSIVLLFVLFFAYRVHSRLWRWYQDRNQSS